MDSRTRVSILNREYILRGEIDSDYVQGLAQKLNSRIDEIRGQTNQKLDDLHVVILVAMNLIDELELRTSQENRAMDDEVVRKTNRLISMLEKGIIGDIY